ncbi:MAG: hypothetical protein IJ744_04900 [Lachnospiraceae bacterium]|nr:hypothetical protein [Lachnospiraceae bacterium]
MLGLKRAVTIFALFLCVMTISTCQKGNIDFSDLPEFPEYLQGTADGEISISYKDRIYERTDEIATILPNGWKRDSDCEEVAVFSNPKTPEKIYIREVSSFHLFVLRELMYEWIFYDGNLYVEEAAYDRYVEGVEREQDNHYADWGKGTISILPVRWNKEVDRYAFPDKDRFTNDPYLWACGMDYDPENKALYVLLPRQFESSEVKIRKFYLFPTDDE